MALRHITDDVLFVIIDALKIEDIIILGAASRRLRTVTTNERRVWAPRLLTKELGLGTAGLDAAACASLASLGCTPRRLLLQSLPWRAVRDDSGDEFAEKAYSWRPRDGVPASLLLSTAQDFVFCEIYENRAVDGKSFFDDGFARKIVRLEDCDLTRFPDDVAIPLDIPAAGHPNIEPWYEVRLFALVGGVLAPMGDTGHCEGEVNDRWQNWSSQLRPFDAHGHTYINFNVAFDVETEGDDDHSPATNFRSLAIIFDELEYDRHLDEMDISKLRSHLRNLGCDGELCFRNFFRRGHAIRAQPTQLFATDSMTPLPFSLDGRSRDAALRAAARAAELAALCAAARAAEACAEAAEATLKVARAEHAVLAAELGKMKAELGLSLF